MKKIITFFAIIIIIPAYNGISQNTSYYKKVFFDAQDHLTYKEYERALPLYLQLHYAYKNNTNISYRVGQCYLHLKGQKHKAIPYLEKAIINTTTHYKPDEFSEDDAPMKAFLLLGQAYRINEQLDTAISTFKKYLSVLRTRQIEEKKMAEREIKICRHAKEMIQSPGEIKIINPGKKINTSHAELRPAVSINQSVIAYTEKKASYRNIKIADRRSGDWHYAIDQTRYIGSGGNVVTSSLSKNGKTLFLIKKDQDNFNIYQSSNDRGWSIMAYMNPPVNSPANETHASLSPDGRTLFIVSDREGGMGGKDIYKLRSMGEGKWGQPVNLGATINTIYNEETPFVDQNGTLFFSSKGHNTMGGFDIFYAKSKGNKYAKPKQLKYPINTPDDNTFFAPVGKGKKAYYSMHRKEGMGGFDIYIIEFNQE